jgi:signal transduction histidine kinase
VTAWAEVGAGAIGAVAASAAGYHDLEGLTRPLLRALAELAGLDCTYLTVFDWDRREQEVRFAHGGDVGITEGSRLALPDGVSREILLGVTRSPAQMPRTHPDSQAAKRLGLRTYVRVPVVLAKHELVGIVCGASRRPQPVGEPVVSVMEFFAQIVADHMSRDRVEATEHRAERAEEQLRARGLFLAVAEHQLKTPLTSLLGAARILDDGWAELGQDERALFLGMVMRSALDLAGRVDGLLVEARADMQSRDLAPVDIDLLGFVEPITRALDAMADHQVRAEVDEGLMAWADPIALHQVLSHLLDNAVKYSPARGLITVLGHRTPGGVALAVVDKGVGLPAGVDVFEAFQRGEVEHVGAVPGIGLGLHIVRNLVEAMGGLVAAAANAEGGTTFTVDLPDRTGLHPGWAPLPAALESAGQSPG